MDLLVTIFIGVAVGVMVELILPGHTIGELVLAILLGSAGALLSRFLGQWFGWYGAGDPAAYLSSLIGAIVTLLLYGLVFRRQRSDNGKPGK